MLIAYASMVDSGGVLVRSPSGDIDIITLFVHHAQSFNVNICIDGTGPQRQVFDISLCELSAEQRKAIVGLHAFSGNDYLSSFFRKGKASCWKKMCAKEEFVSALSLLGRHCLLRLVTSDQGYRKICMCFVWKK